MALTKVTTSMTDLTAASDTVAGPIEIAIQSEMETGTSTTLAVTPGRQKFHPSSAKGWVKAGITGNIIASFNVTSVTDVGVGRTITNWTVAFSSADYCAIATAQKNTGLSGTDTVVAQQRVDTTASACHVDVIDVNGTAFCDPEHTHVAAFGDQ